MQVLEKIVNKDNEGLLGLIGQTVTLFCSSYFYTGRLVGVNTNEVKLEDASIVYETGPFTDKVWKDAQKLPYAWYVRTEAIESYGILK